MNIPEHFDHQGRKQDKGHFSHLIQVAMAGGKIEDSEMEMLHQFGRKVGITYISNELPRSRAMGYSLDRLKSVITNMLY